MSFSSTNINAHNSNNNDDNMANSSLDFVSADVNEVLQEAPQILTNREQLHNGQHSNDQVLYELTMEVTKQSGDEDPMEVTVLRKKLVELAKDEDKPAREEAQNSSSKKKRGKALDSEVCIWIKSKPKLWCQANSTIRQLDHCQLDHCYLDHKATRP
jgi:hypothetical protein